MKIIKLIAHNLNFMDFVTILANLFTIGGVIFAYLVYKKWKNDYRLQKTDEYALLLLEKIKELHFEIELLREPRLYNPNSIENDIEEFFIPRIRERINRLHLEIIVDLLVAKNVLLYHQELLKDYKESISKKILSPLNYAINQFVRQKNSPSFLVEATEIHKILYPDRAKNFNPGMFKKSVLGTDFSVIDDEFNKIVEESFLSIYQKLEVNLIENKASNKIASDKKQDKEALEEMF